jgi:hypothetical protein
MNPTRFPAPLPSTPGIPVLRVRCRSGGADDRFLAASPYWCMIIGWLEPILWLTMQVLTYFRLFSSPSLFWSGNFW